MSGDRQGRRPRVSAVVPGYRTRPGHGRRYGSTGRVSTVAIARLDRRPRGAATAQADTDARRQARNASFTAGLRPARDAHKPTVGATVARSRLYFLHARGHRELRGLERALTMGEIQASLANSLVGGAGTGQCPGVSCPRRPAIASPRDTSVWRPRDHMLEARPNQARHEQRAGRSHCVPERKRRPSRQGFPWRTDAIGGFGRSHTPCTGPSEGREELAARPWPGFSVEAVQTPARVNVTCVTPLGEEVASTL